MEVTMMRRPEIWGYIPLFLYPDDERSVVEQFNERYISGWNEFPGFTVTGGEDEKPYVLSYPGDPAFPERDRLVWNGETIVLFPYSWVMVVQKDGTKRIARMD
jgi:hypothetical protein